MTLLAGFRTFVFLSLVNSPLVIWIFLGALALGLLVSGLMLLGIGEKAAEAIAPLRAYLLVRRFPLEEQGRAQATWQMLMYGGAYRGGYMRFAVQTLREQQAQGAFKPISSRPPVPTSKIFS